GPFRRIDRSQPAAAEAISNVINDRARSLHVMSVVFEHRHMGALRNTARYQLMRSRQQYLLLVGDALVVERPAGLLGEVRNVERVELQHVTNAQKTRQPCRP